MIKICINNDGKEKHSSYSGHIELTIDYVHADNIKDLYAQLMTNLFEVYQEIADDKCDWVWTDGMGEEICKFDKENIVNNPPKEEWERHIKSKINWRTL